MHWTATLNDSCSAGYSQPLSLAKFRAQIIQQANTNLLLLLPLLACCMQKSWEAELFKRLLSWALLPAGTHVDPRSQCRGQRGFAGGLRLPHQHLLCARRWGLQNHAGLLELLCAGGLLSLPDVGGGDEWRVCRVCHPQRDRPRPETFLHQCTQQIAVAHDLPNGQTWRGNCYLNLLTLEW